jgi:hypothetical protein
MPGCCLAAVHIMKIEGWSYALLFCVPDAGPFLYLKK